MFNNQIYFSTVAVFLILNSVVSLPRNFKTTANASSGWSPTGSLTRDRIDHTATVLSNGKVIVIGGQSNEQQAVDMYELYDISRRHWQSGVAHIPRSLHTTSTLLDGNLLIAGGSQDGGAHGIKNTQLYDPIANNWIQIENMFHYRAAHTASVLANGSVLVTGGIGDNLSLVDTCELYDPSNRTWSNTSSMHYARAFHTATVLPNGKILVTGGQTVYANGKVVTTNDEMLNVTEVYDPSIGHWSKADSMNVARCFHTATLLNNGQVLVTGGTHNWELAVAGCQLYNPSTNTWTITGSMYEKRSMHTASLLPNGKVLVVGGFDSHFIAVNTTELYDPTTGNWTKTENMFLGLSDHRASVLKDGNVLISGGMTGDCRFPNISNVAMLYNSLTKTFTSFDNIGHLQPPHKIVISKNERVSTTTDEDISKVTNKK